MPEIVRPFKAAPKKHQPKGISIIYEDKFILVVEKQAGLLTVGTDKERNRTAQALLNTYVKKGNSKSQNRVFIVHRLDKDTSGILVFAKTPQIKVALQENWKAFSKTYYAIVNGHPSPKEGTITSYLAENTANKMFSTKDESIGKLSKTKYKVLKASKWYSLVEIDLLTGRKNQIRVHFADMKNPVSGDKKYGVKEKSARRLALHAGSLTLIHPISEEKMTFTTKIPTYFESMVGDKAPKTKGPKEDAQVVRKEKPNIPKRQKLTEEEQAEARKKRAASKSKRTSTEFNNAERNKHKELKQQKRKKNKRK